MVDVDGRCCSPRALNSKVRIPVVRRNFMNDVGQGFSPHEAHAHQALFGWIMPTIRTSEFTVLQIVGLDAAVVSPRQPYLAPSDNPLAPQLFQNVVLPLFCVLNVCYRNSYAYKLECM